MAKKTIERESLYIKVKEEILRQILAKRWQAGDLLPNEFELADEFGVSQGTLRKALNILTRENVLIRRQGKGTYVSASGAMRFFRYKAVNGTAEIIESERLSVERMPTPTDIQDHFGADNSHCFRVDRMRHLDGGGKLYEQVHVPCELFPQLEENPSINRFLYQYYESEYGIPVLKALNRLRAGFPDADCQNYLGIQGDTPVLCLDHIVYSLTEQVIEFRKTFCHSDDVYYESVLT